MELQDIIKVLNNRKFIIIQAVILVTLTAAVYSYTKKPAYEATATLLYSEKDVGSSIFSNIFGSMSPEGEKGFQTQLKWITLRPVLERVINKLKLNTDAQSLEGSIKVSREAQTNLINVTVTNESPSKAQLIANEIAGQYMLLTRNFKVDEMKSARQELFSKVKDTEEEIIVLANEGKTKKDLPRDLQAKMDMAIGLYVMLAEKHEQLSIIEGLKTGGAQLVSQAKAPENPVSPKPVKDTVLGLFAGMVFGIALAFAAEQLDSRLKTGEDVEKATGLPLLGQIPDSIELEEKDKMIVRSHPNSLTAEAFRTVRTNLQFFHLDGELKSIVVTSSEPGEGKSTTILNLGISLAQAGKRVILLCSDMRRPSLHRYMKVNNDLGLSNFLVGTASLEEIVKRVHLDNLKIITSGPIPPNPSELLNSPRYEQLIEALKRSNDYVLIDAPPTSPVTDSAIIASKTDGVILVVRAGTATREGTKHLLWALQNSGCRLLGAVVTGIKPEGKYGNYKYKYSAYGVPSLEEQKNGKKKRLKIFS